VAVVIAKPGATLQPEAITAALKASLANFKIPKKFFIRPMLPLLASGKVNKMALRDEIREMLKSS